MSYNNINLKMSNVPTEGEQNSHSMKPASDFHDKEGSTPRVNYENQLTSALNQVIDQYYQAVIQQHFVRLDLVREQILAIDHNEIMSQYYNTIIETTNNLFESEIRDHQKKGPDKTANPDLSPLIVIPEDIISSNKAHEFPEDQRQNSKEPELLFIQDGALSHFDDPNFWKDGTSDNSTDKSSADSLTGLDAPLKSDNPFFNEEMTETDLTVQERPRVSNPITSAEKSPTDSTQLYKEDQKKIAERYSTMYSLATDNFNYLVRSSVKQMRPLPKQMSSPKPDEPVNKEFSSKKSQLNDSPSQSDNLSKRVPRDSLKLSRCASLSRTIHEFEEKDSNSARLSSNSPRGNDSQLSRNLGQVLANQSLQMIPVKGSILKKTRSNDIGYRPTVSFILPDNSQQHPEPNSCLHLNLKPKVFSPKHEMQAKSSHFSKVSVQKLSPKSPYLSQKPIDPILSADNPSNRLPFVECQIVPKIFEENSKPKFNRHDLEGSELFKAQKATDLILRINLDKQARHAKIEQRQQFELQRLQRQIDENQSSVNNERLTELRNSRVERIVENILQIKQRAEERTLAIFNSNKAIKQLKDSAADFFNKASPFERAEEQRRVAVLERIRQEHKPISPAELVWLLGATQEAL